MRLGLSIVLALMISASSASAADEKTLSKLQAPEPAELRSITGAQAVKFARVVVQLKPEPWALVERTIFERDGSQTHDRHLVTWDEGQKEVDISTVSQIFAEEMKRAGVPISGDESVFESNGTASLLVGVKIVDMQGRFCWKCRFLSFDPGWTGAVVQTAKWEIYSSLERKVVAAVETHGGFTAPTGGLVGEPDRLVNEAFRDNVRRLIASDDFRRAVTTSAFPAVATPPAGAITFVAARASRPIGEVGRSVAVVYAGDASGSAFLISKEGYLLTNHHVVGGSKFVKIKWSDGRESLGEVVRFDRKRDVALVKTDSGGREPLAIRGGDARPGETVYAVGTPLEDRFQNTLTKGIVSSSRVYDGLSFIQSDVAIDHGNSGGPLLDENGRVIGITQWTYSPDGVSHNLNFFIPIDDALAFLALKPAT